jgi:hypothetical protein
MHDHALPIDWIFQPSRWQPVRRLAEWLRQWAARQLDRRQAPRRMVENIAANYFDGTGVAAASHVVRDVSTSGAFIFADFQWPPGTIVTLTMELTRAIYNRRPPTPVVLRTRVVRCTPDGLGVQFLLEKEVERQTLANFLKDIPA